MGRSICSDLSIWKEVEKWSTDGCCCIQCGGVREVNESTRDWYAPDEPVLGKPDGEFHEYVEGFRALDGSIKTISANEKINCSAPSASCAANN